MSARCLPTVNYLTSLDKYSITSIVMVYIALVWHAVLKIFDSMISKEATFIMDKIVFIVLLIIYCFIHILLFRWLKKGDFYMKILSFLIN
jgi:uncharacterized membrane protein AbrB (regulator of aidB expression)